MPAFRFPRTSQPQQPVGIDWSNPITRGLKHFTTPPVFNDVGKVAGILDTTHIAVKPSIGGVGYFRATDDGSQYGRTGPASYGNKFSVLFVAVPLNNSVTTGKAVSYRNSGGSLPWSIDVDNSTISGPTVYVDTQDYRVARRTYRAGALVYSDTTTTFYEALDAGLWVCPSYASAVPYTQGVITLVAAWNRLLSDADIRELSANPWQIFQPTNRAIWSPASAVVSISRPTSDVTTTGWTGNPDNTTLFTNIDETTASDTDYITSPTITGGESIIFGITPSVAAGTWDVRYRANFVGATADVKITLLDSSNVSQGASSWQTVTSSYADYTASVTTTGTASRVKIEVQ